MLSFVGKDEVLFVFDKKIVDKWMSDVGFSIMWDGFLKVCWKEDRDENNDDKKSNVYIVCSIFLCIRGIKIKIKNIVFFVIWD